MKSTNQREGVLRRWAREVGLTIEEYLLLSQTKKRCQKCKTWKPKKEFASDASRYDGINVRCNTCRKINRPPQWHILTEEEKEKLRERNRNNKWIKGKHLSYKHKNLLRKCRIEEGQKGTGIFYGRNNPKWKGGITPANQIARNSSEYREWRRKVFERDHYTCQRCKDKKGGNLHPHHIKNFSDFPEFRYVVSNGTTLCFNCHADEHNEPLSSRKLRVAKRLSNPKNQLKMF